MVALLGAAEPTTLRTWFAALAAGGAVVAPLQRRAGGASDGQVRDRYGVLWLIGYEHGTDPSAEAVTSGAASSEVPSSEV
jgi:PhnB protein